jgi:hypothetical protein
MLTCLNTLNSNLHVDRKKAPELRCQVEEILLVSAIPNCAIVIFQQFPESTFVDVIWSLGISPSYG